MYDLKRLFDFSVTIEKRHKLAAVQFYKFKRFGHVYTGCALLVHCVRWAGSHSLAGCDSSRSNVKWVETVFDGS